MNRTALLASVVVALVGVALFGLYMKRFEDEVRGGEPIPVLIATQDLRAALITNEGRPARFPDEMIDSLRPWFVEDD